MTTRRRCLIVLLASIVIVALGSPHWTAAVVNSAGSSGSVANGRAHEYTNRLIESQNPYLLLHAHNPVDWYPWGPEAFDKARRESKPIFLSVGYSTCFWCHVAEATIYSDPDIAKLMNEWFVNIKVDREQRPDVDQVYMLATRVITGNGGWPNNVFLTPDLQPFFAGSYFPPADDPVRGTGFPTILRALHEAWINKHAAVLGTAEKVSDAMRQAQLSDTPPVPLEPVVWLRTARESLLGQLDTQHGGFGGANGPKFPRSPELALLLTDIRLNAHTGSRVAVTRTLDAIAFGGIHDHLAGGFHRYSIDATWSVPHFEKMLYDNAQLLELFAEGYQLTGNALYRSVALETAQYLMRDMSAAQPAGFYTAEDSQVDGLEGVSYLWTRAEIVTILGVAAADSFFHVYELAPMPEQTAPGVRELPPHSGPRPGVLRVRLPIGRTQRGTGFADASAMLEVLAPQRARLLAARGRRAQPARDEKMLTGLNGLAIGAFARAGEVLDRPDLVTVSQTVADRIWWLAYDAEAHELQHSVFLGHAHTDGFLEDYAQLGVAFMTLAAVTGNTVWRDRAALLADGILQRFVRKDGSLVMSADQTHLLIPVTDDGDGDSPSGTSAAIELMLRLASAPHPDPRYRSAALRAVSRLSGTLQQYPAVWATAVTALNDYPLPSKGAPVSVAAVGAAPATPTGESGVPTTAEHVRVSAAVQTNGGEVRVVVMVTVDEGYHINANPASFDYLIPTAVRFERLTPSKMSYPKPVRFQTAFATDGLDVYEGTVRLDAQFGGGALPVSGPIHGVVRAQACDARICLPPAELPFSIDSADR